MSDTDPDFAIEAIDLVKKFGDFTAVDSVSFTVPRGSVLGLLGPNGAGKTTCVRMMTTLASPSSGTARIAGFDVRENPSEVRRHMGLTGQAATVDEVLTGRENLRMIGGLAGIPKKPLRARIEELLAQFSLTDAGDKQVKAYSGGMRRRLDLAVSLLTAPPVLFLDEPTTGLDPRSRTELWDVLRSLVAQGTTLLLTTQYLEEADQLADDIVVIDKGRVIEHGTPLQLKERAGAASLVLTVSAAADVPAARALLEKFGSEVFVDHNARRLTTAAHGLADLNRAVGAFAESGIAVDDMGLARPSLDDVFLSLTGHRTEPGFELSCRGGALMTIAHAPIETRPTSLWQQSWIMARRSLIHTKRMPEMLSDVTIQPIVFTVLFAFVFGSAIPTSGVSYREYLLPGILGQTMVFTSFIVATGITTDLDKGIIDRFRSLPIQRSSVLIGRSIASLLHSSIGIVVMAVTGLIIGWRVHGGVIDTVIGFAVLMLFGFAMIWFGILIGSWMKSVEAVNGVMFASMFPLTFLSNAFVPTEGMAPWLRAVAEWNPVSALVQAMRVSWGNDVPLRDGAPWPLQHPVEAAVIWAVALTAILAPLALRAFNNRTTD